MKPAFGVTRAFASGAPKAFSVKPRPGSEDTPARTALIEATSHLILSQGYSAVTARRITDQAGVSLSLIYHYFSSLDGLLLEVFRRGAARSLARMQAAAGSEHPLRALWACSTDTPDNRLTLEFMAMALHHEVIRVAIAAHAERLREIQVEALSRHFKARGIQPSTPPVLISFLIASLSRSLLLESAFGMTSGHAEIEALVETCLRRWDTSAE